MTDEIPTERPAPRTFSDFGVDDAICASLEDAGIIHPFPIQELTLPLALGGADLIGQARTGTGKTLAFGIPLLQRVDITKKEAQALVIVPTRELGSQVADDLQKAGRRRGVDVVAVYGGKAIEPQIKAISDGAPVVVGTPGRLLDLVGRGVLKLGTVETLVLDEADEMLDLGFLPDVEQLIQATAAGRQTLLFSATMPSAVVALARRYMHKPTFLRADVEEIRIAPQTKQHFFSCHRMDKPAVLARILQTPERGLCVVFTRTKRMADVLVEELRTHGVDAAPIHSDLRQDARERALERFRSGKIDVLCATEVAARGLDIDDVTHVVNYDCPDDEKMYLHRIGRTGRAGAAGVAITLALWNEAARLEMIKKALDITEPTHEVFSTSEILDELFELPPREKRRTTPAPSRPSSKPPAKTASKAPSQGSGRGRRTSPREDERPRRRAEQPAAAKASPRPEAPQADTGAESERSVRVRRRTRRAPAAARDDAAPAAITTTSPPAEQRAGDARPSRERTRRERTRREPEPTARPAAERTDRGSAQPDRKRSGDRGRASERTRRGPDERGRPARPPKIDSGTARGSGQPRLRRPLHIDHLP